MSVKSIYSVNLKNYNEFENSDNSPNTINDDELRGALTELSPGVELFTP